MLTGISPGSLEERLDRKIRDANDDLLSDDRSYYPDLPAVELHVKSPLCMAPWANQGTGSSRADTAAHRQVELEILVSSSP